MIFVNNVMQLNYCLACGSENLKLTLDLNTQPLANSYKLTKDEKQEEFPLAINPDAPGEASVPPKSKLPPYCPLLSQSSRTCDAGNSRLPISIYPYS